MSSRSAGPIQTQLNADLRVAMKAGDTTSRDVIRYLLAALKNATIDQGRQLSEADEVGVIRRQEKQRLESIEQFKVGNRQDLVDREQAQLEVLRRYLPLALTDDQLGVIARTVVEELDATSRRDMSRVMPEVIKRTAGGADGRRISEIVKSLLSGS